MINDPYRISVSNYPDSMLTGTTRFTIERWGYSVAVPVSDELIETLPSDVLRDHLVECWLKAYHRTLDTPA